MKKASLWGKGYQIEKRVIGNDDVGDRIYSRRIHTARAESMPGRNFVNLVKVVFLFSFGARIRFAPPKHAGNPDNGWIGRKDRFSVSKTAEAVIKALVIGLRHEETSIVGKDFIEVSNMSLGQSVVGRWKVLAWSAGSVLWVPCRIF